VDASVNGWVEMAQKKLIDIMHLLWIVPLSSGFVAAFCMMFADVKVLSALLYAVNGMILSAFLTFSVVRVIWYRSTRVHRSN
jgi:hypothetical protein